MSQKSFWTFLYVNTFLKAFILYTLQSPLKALYIALPFLLSIGHQQQIPLSNDLQYSNFHPIALPNLRIHNDFHYCAFVNQYLTPTRGQDLNTEQHSTSSLKRLQSLIRCETVKMIVFWLISAAALPALVLLYLFLKQTYTYWARKGFPSLPPDIPWGCLRPVVVQQTKSFGEQVRDIHLQNPGSPYLGLYFLFRPVLLIRDPELVKRVLVTDFDHFYDRGMFYNEKTDPIGANLFVMPGQKWKDLRNKLSPTFTSGETLQCQPQRKKLIDRSKDQLFNIFKFPFK